MFLEACGYETKVFEFISLEHTNKNKMILAVKRAEPVDNAQLLDKIQELKEFYHITEHCLETLLRADGYLGLNTQPAVGGGRAPSHQLNRSWPL